MVCHLHQSKQFRILRIPILTTTKRQAVGILWLVGFLRARTVYYTSRRMLARCPVSGFRKFVRVVLVNLSARGGCTDSTVHHVVLYTNLLFMSYRSKTIAPAPLKFTEPSNSKSIPSRSTHQMNLRGSHANQLFQDVRRVSGRKSRSTA